MDSIIPIVSGGMDSVTLLDHIIEETDWYVNTVVSFNYGQRHVKELEHAAWQTAFHHAEHIIVDLTGLNKHLGGSSLTDKSIEVPDGHYAEETMKITVVPNRNMIMLSIAAGIAVAKGASGIAIGTHAGDHFIYPDCRPEFITLCNRTIEAATEGFSNWDSSGTPIYDPFIYKTKADIVSIGDKNGTNYLYTWSCYKGGQIHCGRCGTCVERKEAFRLAGVFDPTEYEDEHFQVEAFRG